MTQTRTLTPQTIAAIESELIAGRPSAANVLAYAAGHGRVVVNRIARALVRAGRLTAKRPAGAVDTAARVRGFGLDPTRPIADVALLAGCSREHANKLLEDMPRHDETTGEPPDYSLACAAHLDDLIAAHGAPPPDVAPAPAARFVPSTIAYVGGCTSPALLCAEIGGMG